MGNDGQPQDVRERIAGFIHAESHAERKPASREDVQTFQAVAGRLDQLLAEIKEQPADRQFSDEDRKALKNAAAKLDRLLETDSHKNEAAVRPHSRKREAPE